MFIETSAKDDLNVQKVFIDLSESQQHHHHDMRLPSSAGDLPVCRDSAVSMPVLVWLLHQASGSL